MINLVDCILQNHFISPIKQKYKILNDNSIGQKIKLSCHIGVARLTCTVACKNRQVPKTNADQKDDNKTAVAAERKSNIHRRNIPNSTMVGRQNCISVSVI
ncbi:hypothetical protein T4D_12244 [Trichinella pseudospiralis]|uniref:Uncharacterized protein n=1 Tax=Trichinella pseudospiralis TaxID=6337 RepID=A0A0V1FNL1_TRIPS|nr:hypothetical protein T4D_12244 [Trichinella pseudospiralis]